MVQINALLFESLEILRELPDGRQLLPNLVMEGLPVIPEGMRERNRWSVDPTPAKPVLVSIHGTAISHQLLSGSM